MNRQQRIVLLFGLLLFSAAMLGRANEAHGATAAHGQHPALATPGAAAVASVEREAHASAATSRLQQR